MVQAANGERLKVAVNWTDAGAAPAEHLLDYAGLVQVLGLIERLRGKAREGGVGETERACQTEAGDYDDGEKKTQVESASEDKS